MPSEIPERAAWLKAENEPSLTQSRQRVGMAVALAIYATAVYLYASTTVPEPWDLSELVLDETFLTTAGHDETAAHLSPVACRLTVVASRELGQQRGAVDARWNAARSVFTTPSRAAGFNALCGGAMPIYVREQSPFAASAAAVVVASSSADADNGGTSRTVGRFLTLSLAVVETGNRTAAAGSANCACLKQFDARTAALRVVCSVNVEQESAFPSCIAEIHARVSAAAEHPKSGSFYHRQKLLRVIKEYNDVPSNFPGFVEELVMDTVGPETAAEVRSTVKNLLPAPAPQWSVPTWALSRRFEQQGISKAAGLQRIRDRGYVTEQEAASILGDPSWTTALLYPPEQLLALHLPLFLPVTVSLWGALRTVLVKWRRNRRRERQRD